MDRLIPFTNLIIAWSLETDISVILTSESCPLPNLIEFFWNKLIMCVPVKIKSYWL